MKHIYDKKEFVKELKILEKEINESKKSYYNNRYSITFDGIFYSVNSFKEIVEEMITFQLGKDNLYQVIRNLKYSEPQLSNLNEFTNEIINILKTLEQKDNVIFNDIIENIPIFLINQNFINWYFKFYKEMPEQYKNYWINLFTRNDIAYEMNIGNLKLSNEQMKFLINEDNLGLILERYYLNNNIFDWIIKKIKKIVKNKGEDIVDTDLGKFRFILNNKLLISKQLIKLIELLPYKIIYVLYKHQNHSKSSFNTLFDELKDSVYNEELLQSNHITRKQIFRLIRIDENLIDKIRDGWFVPSNKTITILRDEGLL